MEDQQVYRVMIIIAVATPTLAVIMHYFADRTGMVTIRKGRFALLLIAGPANLLLWIVFNKYLDRTGSNSVFGILLAAIVFVAMGHSLGIWRRDRPERSIDSSSSSSINAANAEEGGDAE